MSAPLLTVVLPTYNGERHVVEAVESVLAQTFGDFELLVLDDGSSDATPDRIAGLADPRIRLHRQPANLGLPTNMNVGIAMARGKYLARVDQDDVARPERFARQVAFLEANESITVVGSQVEHFGGGDDFVSAMPPDDASIKARFISGQDYFANQASMGRLDFYRSKRLRFDANLYVIDDLGFWVDCMFEGAQFANLQEPLTRYRVHRDMTSLNLDAVRLDRSKLRLYSRLLPACFPTLDGRACGELMALYRYEVRQGMTLETLTRLHAVVGTHIRTVDTRWGQSEQECRNALLVRLNAARSAALEAGTVSAEQCKVLDALFHAAQS